MWDVVGYGAIILFLLFKGKGKPSKTPTAMVDIGTPTVVGSGSENLGGTDYQTNLMP